MKLSKKDKRELAKTLAREMKEDNAVAKILKNNKNNKLKLKVKVSTFIDPKTKEKKIGGCIELLESKSNNKLLDGWNLDLGATTSANILLGISKDFDLLSSKDKKTEWSLGGYVDVMSAGKNIVNHFRKGTSIGKDVKFYVGLSKGF